MMNPHVDSAGVIAPHRPPSRPTAQAQRNVHIAHSKLLRPVVALSVALPNHAPTSATLTKATRAPDGRRQPLITVASIPVQGPGVSDVEDAVLSEVSRRDRAEQLREMREQRAAQCITRRRYRAFSSPRASRYGGYVLQNRYGSADAAATLAMSPSTTFGSFRTKRTPGGTLDTPMTQMESSATFDPLQSMPLPRSLRTIRSASHSHPLLPRGRSDEGAPHWNEDEDPAAGVVPLVELDYAVVFPRVVRRLRRLGRFARALIALRRITRRTAAELYAALHRVRASFWLAWARWASASLHARRMLLRRTVTALREWAYFNRRRRHAFIQVCEGSIIAFRVKRIVQVWFRHAYVFSRVRATHSLRSIPDVLTRLQVRLLYGPPRPSALPSSPTAAGAGAIDHAAGHAVAEAARLAAADPLHDMQKSMVFNPSWPRSLNQPLRSLRGLQTASLVEWTELAVRTEDHLRDAVVGSQREYWPLLRTVLSAWRQFVQLEKRNKADNARVRLWLKEVRFEVMRRACWTKWHRRRTERRSAMVYCARLQHATMRRWLHQLQLRRSLAGLQEKADALLRKRQLGAALVRWRNRFDRSSVLEMVGATTIAQQAGRFRQLMALWIGRPEDQAVVTLWYALASWRSFIAHRRLFQAFVVQQHIELCAALVRRAFVVWRSHGNVCWVTGRTAPGFDYVAHTNERSRVKSLDATMIMNATSTSPYSPTAVSPSSARPRGASVFSGTATNTARVRNAVFFTAERETTTLTSVTAARDTASAVHPVGSRGQPISLPLPCTQLALPMPNGKLWCLSAPVNWPSLRGAEALIRNTDRPDALPPRNALIALKLPSSNNSYHNALLSTCACLTQQIRAVMRPPLEVRRSFYNLMYGTASPPKVHRSATWESDDGEADESADLYAHRDGIRLIWRFIGQRTVLALFLHRQLLSVWHRAHDGLVVKQKLNNMALVAAELASLGDDVTLGGSGGSETATRLAGSSIRRTTVSSAPLATTLTSSSYAALGEVNQRALASGVGGTVVTQREAALLSLRTRRLSALRQYDAEQRSLCVANAYVLCRAELPPHVYSGRHGEPDPTAIAAVVGEALIGNFIAVARARMWANHRRIRAEAAAARGAYARACALSNEPTGLSKSWQPKRTTLNWSPRTGKPTVFFYGGAVSLKAWRRIIKLLVRWRCRALERVLVRHGRSRLGVAVSVAGAMGLVRLAERRRRADVGAGGATALLSSSGRPPLRSVRGHGLSIRSSDSASLGSPSAAPPPPQQRRVHDEDLNISVPLIRVFGAANRESS